MLKYMLLQVRNANDPMREQEVRCFGRALECLPEQIRVIDLIEPARGVKHITRASLDAVDAVLIGGSGDYSVATGGPWLPDALGLMAELVAIGKPTFASCWGFQAMAKALGGEVIFDPVNAELGTLPITLTPEGEADPVFGRASAAAREQALPLLAVMGHEDRVKTLPDMAVRLAFTGTVANQAFRLEGKPIYATQFHPELDTRGLIERLETYPRYAESFAGMSLEAFVETLKPTPMTGRILAYFVDHVFN